MNMFRFLTIALLLFVPTLLPAAEEPAPHGDGPAYGRSHGREPVHGPGFGRHGDGRGKAGPCYYGSRTDGSYGACKPVLTVADAVRRIRESGLGDAVIFRIEERTWFFKADILDKDGRLLDKIIIHKRSGRIRSIL